MFLSFFCILSGIFSVFYLFVYKNYLGKTVLFLFKSLSCPFYVNVCFYVFYVIYAEKLLKSHFRVHSVSSILMDVNILLLGS